MFTNQHSTPIFNSLLTYHKNNTTSFHVPGHKRGLGMYEEFREFVGDNVLSIDVTVFEQVDSFHNPKGVIKESLQLAKEAFGADRTFFCLHGTSGAIQIMILSSVGRNDKVIIPRNAHKSVAAGLILSGACPVYVEPEIDRDFGIPLNVSPQKLREVLQDNPDTKAVLVLNPTYYGISPAINEISELVHSKGIPLLVDEAHGPHFHFHKYLPQSAMSAKADMCSQSTHKILGSLTQSSMIHVQGTRVDSNKVRNVLSMMHTTSPSYVLLASLDIARKQIYFEGEKLIGQVMDLAEYTRREINKIKGFYCFGREILYTDGAYDMDPTKLTINCKELGINGYELERLLSEKYHIQVELADFTNILCVLTLGTKKACIEKLIGALQQISRHLHTGSGKRLVVPHFEVPKMPPQILTPNEAYWTNKVTIPIKDSISEVSGEFIMAYPPGIPVLCPGERITPEIIEYVHEMKRANLVVQGTCDPNVEYIQVIA